MLEFFCWETLATKLPKYGRSARPHIAQTNSEYPDLLCISLYVISQTKSDGDWWLEDYSEDPIRVSAFVMIIYNEYL